MQRTHRSTLAPLFAALVFSILTAALMWGNTPRALALTATPSPSATAGSAATATPNVATPAVTATPSGPFILYTVRPGENLFRIALRYNLTARQVAEANGIVNPSLVLAGQTLRIPVSESVVATATADAIRAQTGTPTPAPVTATSAATTAATSAASGTPAPTIVGGSTYVVQAGDTLFRIAARNGTTVQQILALNNLRDPNSIIVGQRLQLPPANTAVPTAAATSAPTSVATAATAAAATAAPTAVGTPSVIGGTYVVQAGDTLARIALRNGTTVAALVSLNNLSNPNVIFIGQRLNLPTPGAVIPTATPSAASSGTPVASADTPLTPSASGNPGASDNRFGVIAYFGGGGDATLAADLAQLGGGWVKAEARWRDLEPTEGSINFDALDSVVNALDGQGFRILLTVTTAPNWTRAVAQENGPPDDLAAYATFIGAVAARYAGKVDAYEIWSSPNLRREWNSSVHSISAANYVTLLQGAYNAIEAADPQALVISAGLAPTGFNDGVNAIDDRVFLRAAYAAGLARFSDAIGAHPAGFANPPTATCCTAASPTIATHFEAPSFYFLNTLRDYRTIMTENRDGNAQLWVTEYGWGSSADTVAPSASNVYFSYTSLEQQARYNSEAYTLAQALGYVGPMFLNNYNACSTLIGNTEACYYSLVAPDGTQRPAFAAAQSVVKGG
jgi:polysaccharide biosynthesis protein PslG